MTKRDLRVTSDGKIVYDINKKIVPFHSITGFKDNFDNYHKMLYHEAREEAHDLIIQQSLRKPTNPYEDRVTNNQTTAPVSTIRNSI